MTNTQMGATRINSEINFRNWLVTAMSIIGFAVLTSNATLAVGKKVHITAFGDSLTAGYGLPPGADFATRLEIALTKRGHRVRITNSGVSGDTTSAGLARFDWAVSDDTDAVILELGANDALRGISPRIARANLDKILAKLAARKIPVLIAGMQAPANWGKDYEDAFNPIFADLAKQYQAQLYPFFLDGVIDKPNLKLADALHPNEAGVDEIVRRILPSVEKLIARVKMP